MLGKVDGRALGERMLDEGLAARRQEAAELNLAPDSIEAYCAALRQVEHMPAFAALSPSDRVRELLRRYREESWQRREGETHRDHMDRLRSYATFSQDQLMQQQLAAHAGDALQYLSPGPLGGGLLPGGVFGGLASLLPAGIPLTSGL